MKKYKLTNQNLQTRNGCQWQIGVEKETSGTGDLCSEGWLHYYHHPLLALLLNPIHANISDPKLFEIKALGKHKDDHGLKGGCTKQTLMKEIPLPVISITQKIAFAILCSLSVYSNPTYKKWADDWLSGKDRTYDAAADAAYAARAAARAAAADAADAYAANAATYAADAADAYAADAADAADAYAADAATVCATAAASGATHSELNLIKLAKKAMKL